MAIPGTKELLCPPPLVPRYFGYTKIGIIFKGAFGETVLTYSNWGKKPYKKIKSRLE